MKVYDENKNAKEDMQAINISHFISKFKQVVSVFILGKPEIVQDVEVDEIGLVLQNAQIDLDGDLTIFQKNIVVSVRTI